MFEIFLKLFEIDNCLFFCLCFWFICFFLFLLEEMNYLWQVILFYEVNLKKMFLFLLFILFHFNFYNNFYFLDFGFYIDFFSEFIFFCIIAILFFFIFLDEKDELWLNNNVDNPLCDLFLVLSLILVIKIFLININFVSMILLFECLNMILYIISLRVLYKNLLLGEAVLKYVLSSAVSSSFLYIGLFFNLWAFTFLNFFDLNIIFSYNIVNYLEIFLYSFGFFLFILSFIFKFGIFPFHFWMADLYQSLNFSNLGLFMVIPKLVFLLIFSRYFTL